MKEVKRKMTKTEIVGNTIGAAGVIALVGFIGFIFYMARKR